MIFKLNGKNNSSKELTVRRQKIYNALCWLTGENSNGEPNNFLYHNVNIDTERLNKLPEDGHIKLSELEVSANLDDCEEMDYETDIEDNDLDNDGNNLPDFGPINENEERVFDKNSEMSSFIPSKIEISKEADQIRDDILNQSENELDIGNVPVNEYNTPYLASLAFPTLFPDTKGDPTNPAIMREVAKSDTESFSEKLKHLVKFGEVKGGKWNYRFAAHPRFSFWGFNMLYRKRLINQGNFFLKQNPGDANLSIDELRDMIINEDYNIVMKKLMRYSKNVTGTNAYWCDVKDKLKATIIQMGTPTIFWTLSMADFHWPDIHDLFFTNDDDDDDERSANFRQNIIDNPHIVDWLFTERVKSFVKHWLYECMNASWHWYRFEFSIMRGSIHCHGLAKLKDDPGICELTELALKGFLSNKLLQENQSNLDLDLERHVLEIDIANGKNAESQICNYVDSLMTAVNPFEGAVDEWVKPKIHPCKKRLETIPEEELEKDYADLANSVQRHTKCSSAYCLRNKNGQQKCRFNFPFECTDKTHVVFERKKLKSGEERYVPNIVLKRNDPRMNRHQRL